MDPLLVILDLDETLVFAADESLAHQPDFEVGPYLIYKRPFLDEFIAQLHGRFPVAVWTAAGRLYAEPVVHTIIPWHEELAFVWCSERCTNHFDHETRNHTTIKKLRKVEARGYDLGRVLMIDDSPEKHIRNYGNLVHVRPFLGDPSDSELPALSQFIHSLAETPNIRAIDKRNWRDAVPPG